MRKLPNIWLALFLGDVMLCVALFWVSQLKIIQFLSVANKMSFLKFYPHLGLALFYFMKVFFALRLILVVLAVECLIFFLTSVFGRKTQKPAEEAGAKRILLFKLMAALLFSLAVPVVAYLFTGSLGPNDTPAFEINEAVNRRNNDYASGNSFGFTDRERTKAKPKGIFRIAVLGDSFIYGDGLPYEKVWSHKLEHKLLADYDSLEVLHWGKDGWSTLDEFNFFKAHGKDFNIDLLIIGWVDNDPDLGKWKQVRAQDAQKEHPLIYALYPPLARKLITSNEWKDYDIWFNQLYSHENLIVYGEFLTQFHTYLVSQKVKCLFVMTPGPLYGQMKPRFDSIEPIITHAGFNCLDLYDSVEKKLSHYPESAMQANPVNSHPGEIMTEEFASEVKDYLEQNTYLQNIPKRNN